MPRWQTALVLMLSGMGVATVHADDTALSFFKHYQATGATISPNGKLVALGEQIDGHAIVSILPTSGSEKEDVFRGSDLLQSERSYVLGMQWVDDRFLAIVVTESRQAIAELIDTKNSRHAYIVDTHARETGLPHIIYTVKTRGTLVNALSGREGEFLFSKNGNVSRLFRIKVEKLNPLGAKLNKRTLVDGGQFTMANEVAKFDGHVLRWFVAADGSVRSVFAINQDRELVLASIENDAAEWEPLKTWRFDSDEKDKGEEKNPADEEEIFVPLAMGESSDEFYAVLEHEGQSDGLYVYNARTEERELLYRHPTADIYTVLLDRTTHAIRGVGIVDEGMLRYDYIREGSQRAVEQVQAVYGEQSIRIVDSDKAGNFFIFSVHSFSRPGSFILWNRSSTKITKIGTAMPWLTINQKAKMFVGSTVSHDLAIPYLLTLPASQGTPHPLVLLPHGGPIGILDERNFNPVSQYLVSQGFAVLQVNYRGSAGYSDEFLEAGKREWGGKILDDIMAVYDEVVTRPDIDSGRTCIFGGSYGGYAAMVLGIRFPEKFRCMGSVAGVSDINLSLSRRDLSTKSREWYKDYVGDIETEFEALSAISPAYIADQARIPVFLAHGTDDDVVDIEHAYRMKYALDRAGKEYEFHVLQDVGHGFSTPEQAADLYIMVVEFLTTHLMKQEDPD